MNSGIYMIVSPSGKVYVGSSKNLTSRRADHFRALRKGAHHCDGLQRAFDKYGNRLAFDVIEMCPVELLLVREQWWMDEAPSLGLRLYNSSRVAGRVEHTPEVRAKISAKLGTPEARAASRERARAHFGTPEARAANAERTKLRYADPAERAAQSERLKVVAGTPEARAANSARMRKIAARPEFRLAARERMLAPDIREANIKRAKAQFGAPAARAAQSERMRARMADSEYRKKLHGQVSQKQRLAPPRPGVRFKGVCFDKSRGKWVANLQNRLVGRFSTAEDAALAYDRAAFEAYGAGNCYLNFPTLAVRGR